MIECEIVEPDPKRMIEGLRDTGYSFNTAVADLIDNSIAAEANNVHIWIKMDYGGNIKLMIADDGIGMNREELRSAMKYGSPARTNPRSLGKFGLGMKTASTAYCRRLSVISRRPVTEKALKATWDLDHVSNKGKWELLFSDPTPEEIEHLDIVATDKTGTLVVWEKVDRVLKEYADPSGKYARIALDKSIEDLEEHISMVYQRFLDLEDEREKQKIKIFVNEKQINAWDPFCSNEGEPLQVDTRTIESQNGEKTLGKFTIRAFVIPRREEFSSPDAAKKAKVSNDWQGFYIYRENRLIHHADWLGMYSQEPHLSLLRVEFSFDSDLDDAFQVDIKKSKIALNSELYRWTKESFLPPVRKVAEDRYRKGEKKIISRLGTNAHDGSNRNIEGKEKDVDQAEITVVDADKNKVQVKNEEGITQLTLIIEQHPQKPGEYFIQPVDSIDEGLLWQPALIGGKQAVQINKGHAYYRKVYLPNILDKESPVGTIQGMDALLWALSIAELKTVNEATKEHFNDLRYDVSRILRKLVESLPEPPESNGDVN